MLCTYQGNHECFGRGTHILTTSNISRPVCVEAADQIAVLTGRTCLPISRRELELALAEVMAMKDEDDA